MVWRSVLMIDPVSAQDPRTDFSGTFRRADPATPLLSVDDLAAKRGDGIFETIGVFGGATLEIDAHLERLAHSAALCDLPAPNLAQWRQAVSAILDGAPGDCAVRLNLSRGLEGTGVPTGWLTATGIPDHAAVQATGVSAVTLDRGIDSGAAERAPWLLLGAKTMSYAVNMAAGREAARRGAEEALFVSSDGVLLEAPTATLLLRIGGRYLTPEVSSGVLHGTTQLAVFGYLESRGLPTAYERLTREDLRAADAAWLLSSIRLVVPLRSVDGDPVPVDVETTRLLNDHLRGRG